ncbi:MAG: hypothetical protein RI995_1295 [Bacteroidota bacterium]|jgi:hypothetical protein
MKRLICFLLLFTTWSCTKDQAQEIVPVTTSPPPSAATLSIPANNELCLSGSKLNDTYTEVSFEWQAAQNTTSYDVVITNLNTNISQTSLSKTNKTTIILEAGIPYSWNVISKSSTSNTTATSATWKFYLSGNGKANLAPYPADGLVPKSGASVGLVDGKATFSWTGQDPDSNTLSYEVYLDTDINKVSKHEVAPIKSSTNTTSIPLKSGQIYYWQVKTFDGNLSSFTQVFSFRTI